MQGRRLLGKDLAQSGERPRWNGAIGAGGVLHRVVDRQAHRRCLLLAGRASAGVAFVEGVGPGQPLVDAADVEQMMHGSTRKRSPCEKVSMQITQPAPFETNGDVASCWIVLVAAPADGGASSSGMPSLMMICPPSSVLVFVIASCGALSLETIIQLQLSREDGSSSGMVATVGSIDDDTSTDRPDGEDAAALVAEVVSLCRALGEICS
eukprot:CAMPEP_0198117222 /NCGR_PEP_ID=MMETSP1442-20131203/17241_1 /TAXON_ID= /ORGANISM="Craspedostauros australis, Strain CCMP3328" /LENGTH=208 /DNA_ID=CAMNT_0043775229 /DNA_START=164 /DNA_END=791 /DNA_ORIENTATION=+